MPVSRALDVPRVQALAAKSAQLLEDWLRLQDAGTRHMANAGNIIQRMPALTSADSYQGLQAGMELKPLLVAKQLWSLEVVLGRLQAVMRDMADVVAAQEKQCVDACAAMGASTSCATCTSTILANAASVAQVLESMEDVWYMCRDELCMKAALLAQVHQGISVAHFAAINSLFTAPVHLQRDSLPVVLLSSCR